MTVNPVVCEIKRLYNSFSDHYKTIGEISQEIPMDVDKLTRECENFEKEMIKLESLLDAVVCANPDLEHISTLRTKVASQKKMLRELLINITDTSDY